MQQVQATLCSLLWGSKLQIHICFWISEAEIEIGQLMYTTQANDTNMVNKIKIVVEDFDFNHYLKMALHIPKNQFFSL